MTNQFFRGNKALTQCPVVRCNLIGGGGPTVGGCWVEVCMEVGNSMGIPFPWEYHGSGNSHTAHDGIGNRNGNSIISSNIRQCQQPSVSTICAD